jgi:hypothetical protein
MGLLMFFVVHLRMIVENQTTIESIVCAAYFCCAADRISVECFVVEA